MRSGSAITLSKGWWKKEQPQGLAKSAGAFEGALEAYAKAEAALGKAKPEDAVKAFEAALDGLATAGKAVAAEARAAEKKTKDKKARADLSNTQSVMGKPLAKEIVTARKKLAPIEETLAAGDYGTADAHRAYIERWAPKIKRRPVSFALGLPSYNPEDMRFNFHYFKAPRGLVVPLKKHAGVRKFTYGKIGTAALAEEVGEDAYGMRTLCLHIEGRRIPGLAKRLRLMLKKLGVTQFNKVKILEGDQEIDGDDEDGIDDDTALEAFDLDGTDGDDDAFDDDDAFEGDDDASEGDGDDGEDDGAEPDPGRRARLDALAERIAALKARVAALAP